MAAMFEAGLSSVQNQTKAQVGDKTMMDALIPAVKVFREASKAWKSIKQALQDATEAAKRRVLATKDFKARFGRAKNLGDRTLGSQDLGATSISLLFQGFFECVA
jgi:dihydroxyacetone kinase-like protein